MRRCKYDFKWELFPIHIIIYLWIYADMVGGRMQKESILLGKLLAIRSDSVKVGVGNHVLLIEKQICLVSDSVNLCLLKQRGFDCWIKYKSIHIKFNNISFYNARNTFKENIKCTLKKNNARLKVPSHNTWHLLWSTPIAKLYTQFMLTIFLSLIQTSPYKNQTFLQTTHKACRLSIITKHPFFLSS